VEKTIEYSLLLRSPAPTSTPSRVATVALLWGGGVISSLLLICNIMYLGLGTVLLG
jgi:hypothetical protein